jgi:hypothetical protein
LSKVKYPDREKIRKQIDIILDKSDLFKDSQLIKPFDIVAVKD